MSVTLTVATVTVTVAASVEVVSVETVASRSATVRRAAQWQPVEDLSVGKAKVEK